MKVEEHIIDLPADLRLLTNCANINKELVSCRRLKLPVITKYKTEGRNEANNHLTYIKHLQVMT